MAESAFLYSIQIEIRKGDPGLRGGPNSARQSVGNGVTILSQSGALNPESPIQNTLQVNQSQLNGLLGYIGLIDAGIDTSAIESEVATVVAAN